MVKHTQTIRQQPMNYLSVYHFVSLQTRNKEFFRAREYCLELGHFDKQSSTTRKENAPQGKISIFSPGNSKKLLIK